MASLGEFFLGKPQSVQQVSRLNPEQQQVFSQLLNQLGGSLANQDFSGIESAARRGFEQKTIPTILERLTAMGGDRSSAVARQLGSAGADLESQLAGMRGNYNQNQLRTLLGFGLSPQVENIVSPEQQGFLQALLSALAGGAGMGLGLLAQPMTSGIGSIMGGLKFPGSVSANMPNNLSF